MRYDNVCTGRFVRRNNRFAAVVEIGGKEETVHVKNTGRLRELLQAGATVYLSRAKNPARKTGYDLVSVVKQGLGVVNIDSQAPNAVMREWLAMQEFDVVRPEYTYGDSRFDFYMEKNGERYLLEVKGCTLERDGIGYFPDAPTDRGVKHLKGLAAAVGAGYRCAVAFVIQMPVVREVRPNAKTHPAFAAAVADARAAGVEVWYMTCRITPDTLAVERQYRAEN